MALLDILIALKSIIRIDEARTRIGDKDEPRQIGNFENFPRVLTDKMWKHFLLKLDLV